TQVEADAAANRVDVAFERRACAERYDRNLVAGADSKDLRDFGRCLRITDQIRQRGRVVRLAVAVMLADRRSVGRPLAEQTLERADGQIARGLGGAGQHQVVSRTSVRGAALG